MPYRLLAVLTDLRMAKSTLDQDLLNRRQKVLSPTYFHHYDDPLIAARAEGVFIWDTDGKAYLDCYNNVPSVGHCNPHVIDAMHRQASLINTHSRYLHDSIVTYAERLTATLPPELDMCAFVCTGTEANGLAYELARVVTGNTGVVVTDGSYHGNALAVADISLYRTSPNELPHFVSAIAPPLMPHNDLGEPSTDGGKEMAALAEPVVRAQAGSESGLAMLIIDPIFDAPGIFTAPPGYLAELSKIVRGVGGVVVADEVQAGLTRLGDNMWGFMDSEIVPDIVTMGKPMGAGYPLAVVAAKRAIFEEFAAERRYFNTFGGTPLAGAAGNAVLDVIEDSALQQSVHKVGCYLLSQLQQLKSRFDCIGDIRGKGLFLGIEVVESGQPEHPDPEAANAIVNEMRRKGVLISACGLVDNVLKIRPPLVFSKANADQLLETLWTVLKEHAHHQSNDGQHRHKSGEGLS